MICQLTGTVVRHYPAALVLDVRGVGYFVHVSAQSVAALADQSENITLFIYHHITEQSQSLYGFSSEEEQALFELLITVKGIGPKVGISILSGMSPDRIQEVIAQQDAVALAHIPGIGKKTAERIILELKDKVTTAMSSPATNLNSQSGLSSDAVSALLSLGYKQVNAEKAIRQLSGTKTYTKVTDLIRDGLALLNS